MSEEQEFSGGNRKRNNVLPLYGNDSMNLNPLILTNIQSSVYFKVTLFQLKTYHEVIDEIYYQVKHLEPWERGSRKTSGNSGMCGSVRGVGAGGIVSSAFCLLYKLYTLKLTRKQLNGLIKHTDSPYIRGLGFMYIRYTQPPADLFDWYEEFLQDEEEIDVKAGGGQTLTVGQLCRQFMVKLDWFSTLFPRIPVPIQKQIEQKLGQYDHKHGIVTNPEPGQRYVPQPVERRDNRNYERDRPPRERDYKDERKHRRSRSKDRRRYDDDEPASYKRSKRSHSRERYSSKSKNYDRSRSRERRRRYEDERASRR
ncbi:CLUMA_CG006561, isoform A [Clunio marinus]|uniref:Pre-mRNA-splicing factor 38 n=1 Tax=Clunio marinus TaxID=568069 RepID=A0A1J1HY02_9DIPT|nr:CLUMA_CG006561, isoform A [Clunio marinus]